MRPLAIDLYSGLGGWAEGLEAAGWDVIRVDIADMFAETGTPKPPNCLLMLQDVRTFHGSQAKDADLIVASPPCQEFSWMAMPWSRAKQVGRALRGKDEFPENYRGSRTLTDLTELFDACFRIQRECNEVRAAEGKPPIPMVVENVRGAKPWVGMRPAYSYGSFWFWGDVPALMPATPHRYGPSDGNKRTGRTMCYPAGFANPDAVKGRTGKLGWQDEPSDGRKVPGFRFDGSGGSFQTASVGVKVLSTEGRRTDVGNGTRFTSRDCGIEGIKAPTGAHRLSDAPRTPDSLASASSSSSARKAASAKIAKIPFIVSNWVGEVYLPK